MPFEEIETITRGNEPPSAKITYLRGAHKGSKNVEGKKPKLVITVPTTICGVSKSEKFALLIGTGSDAGKLLIRGANKNGTKNAHVEPTQHKHYFRFNFGFVPKLGDDIFDGGAVPVRRLSYEEFEITVPKSWFEGAK